MMMKKNDDFRNKITIDYKLSFNDRDRLIYKHVSSCLDNGELKKIFSHLKNELQKIINSEHQFRTIPKEYEYSPIYMPSISPHSQNETGNYYNDDPAYVIECLVACFENLAKINPIDARYQVISYLNSDIPFFKRLSLHFLRYEEVFSSKEVEDYFKKYLDAFLWSDTYIRERFRLLDTRWKHLSKQFQDLIITKILNGRQAWFYEKELPQEKLEKYKERDKGRLLSWFLEHKLLEDKKVEEVKEILKKIKNQHPDYHPDNVFPTGEKAEFSSWMGEVKASILPGVGTEPNEETFREKDPKKIVEKLVAEIQERKKSYDIDVSQNMDFSKWMLSENSKYLLEALDIIVVRNGEDEIDLLGSFFGSISYKEEIISSNYKKLLSLIRKCSDDAIKKYLHSITDCFRNIIIKVKQTSLADEFDIWERLYDFSSVQEIDNFERDYVFYSINSSLGILYFTLIKNYFSKPRKWDCGLDDLIKEGWERLKQIQGKQKHLAYAQYGMHMNGLSIVDYEWFKENVYPVLHSEAELSIVLWDCFLSSPRCTLRFIELVKNELIDLSDNLEKINHVDGYITLISDIALNHKKYLEPGKFREILSKLDKEKLSSVIYNISRQLADAKDNKKEEFWNKKVRPWIKYYWPVSKDYKNEEFNDDWFACILKVPKPKEDDFELINRLLYPSPKGLSSIIHGNNGKIISSHPGYLSLILTLIKNGIDLYDAGELKIILENMSQKHSIKERDDYKEIAKILKKAGVDI